MMSDTRYNGGGCLPPLPVPPPPMTQQWLVGFQGKTLVVESDLDDILKHVSLRTHWPIDCLELISLSSPLQQQQLDQYHAQYPYCTVRVRSSIRGGKGGFGTLLKGQSRQMGAKLTTDFGACRDLQGRRLRHVNDEIKLRKWREAQAKKKAAGEHNNHNENDDDDENDDDYLTNTPTGIYNWHLMTPSWAQISNKASNKMKRNLKRHFKQFQTQAEKKEEERKARDEQYNQSVTDYVRQAAREAGALHVSDAIQQGLEVAGAKGPGDDAIVTDDEDGAQPNSLITLSGDVIVEESPEGWKVQSISDFGTMALVLECPPAKDALLYYEVHLETAGLHQVGWADLNTFKPVADTGDGVGDDAGSYAFDASRSLAFHAGMDTSYGHDDASMTKAGDILGCSYETTTNSLSYTLNGKDLGVAFRLDKPLPLVPALSCNQGEILDLKLKKAQMKYFPEGATAVFELVEEDVVTTIDHVKEEVTVTAGDNNNTAAVIDSDDGKPPAKKSKLAPIDTLPLNLNKFDSVEQLEELGMDRLKSALLAIQCKCGGSLTERATRLFSLKGLDRKDYPLKVRARNFVV